MKSPILAQNENSRLNLLRDLEILDTPKEEMYDEISQLAASICETPVAFISLADKDRHFFKSEIGLFMSEISREIAFCSHNIHDNSIMHIPDADKDESFYDSPVVTGGPLLKFYLGIPLELRKDIIVGSLCVADYVSRDLNEEQIKNLKILGKQVLHQLELRLKNKELSSLRNAEKDLISIVSHELRTPITSIYGSIRLLKSRTIPVESERGSELIDMCLRNAESLRTLVNDLLASSSLEHNQINLNKKLFCINEMVKRSMKKMEPFLKKCKVKVEIHLNRNIPGYFGDEFRISQVLSNLISNAAKFSRPGSSISIKTELIDSHLKISVQDFGQGIPEEVQDKIFLKFRRFGETNQNLPSTGLGLYIAKQLVEAHEGSITFDSTVNQGTTFYVRLPILKQSLTAFENESDFQEQGQMEKQS